MRGEAKLKLRDVMLALDYRTRAMFISSGLLIVKSSPRGAVLVSQDRSWEKSVRPPRGANLRLDPVIRSLFLAVVYR